MTRALNKAAPISTRVTLGALFAAFLKTSMYGFGGPIVWARRIIVEERRWLGDGEFADILSFCQFLPGPNVVSVTVCIGAKFRGPAGALAALAGFILVPCGFAALAFVGLALVKIPLLIVVLGLVPLSIALARAEPAPAQ
ncbi:MAG: chromate transporter [Alphaproteobacteria bacterium]|nr:chromate transporter [Alphaproteobacteria bacterium]MBV9966903.1 chromate transporter [Alphaproteobacteria bacterium]